MAGIITTGAGAGTSNAGNAGIAARPFPMLEQQVLYQQQVLAGNRGIHGSASSPQLLQPSSPRQQVSAQNRSHELDVHQRRKFTEGQTMGYCTPGPKNVVADAFSRLCENQLPAKRQQEIITSIKVFPNRIPDEHYQSIFGARNTAVGHFGVEKTLSNLIKSDKKWKGMRRHIRQFIQQCPVCQKLRERKLAIKAHPFTTASYSPMEVLNIDTIGPLTDCFSSS